MKKILGAVVSAGALVALTGQAVAEWKPAGPIKLMIGFRAGGGADTQARLIGQELAAKKGWKFIYQNVAGKGGSNLARALKKEKADGLSLGMGVTSIASYVPLISKKAGYTVDDFNYLVLTAPTQMGVVVRSDSGWKSLADVAKAAKGGKQLKFAVMAPRLGDGAYVISKKFGIKFNSVKVKGGKGVLNGLMAKDVDIGFIAGIHTKAVKAGDLVNLASAESSRLRMSPDAPTLKELGIPYDFGARFIMFAPKGIPADARKAIIGAVVELLKDPKSKAAKFINRAFGKPPLIVGDDLEKLVRDEIKSNKQLLASLK
jgi:tripartite-type tricarboxylate transporter receptor subunit TctC